MLWGRLDASAGLTIDLLTAVFAAGVAVLKHHFTKTAKALCEREETIRHPGLLITDRLAALDGELLSHARAALRHACEEIDEIGRGRVPLDPREYYRTLRVALESSRRGTNMYAVSSIDALRWREDRNQVLWLECNIAAVKRGVLIHRVFILKKDQMASSEGQVIMRLIEDQIRKNIQVHAIWLEDILHEDPRLRDDFVLFPEAERAFVDHHDPEEPMRIVSAELILSPNPLLGEYATAFEAKLKDYWLAPSDLAISMVTEGTQLKLLAETKSQ
jgi:hypothetical protein